MSNGCCDPRAPRPKMLRVGGMQVGVIGLERIFYDVLSLGPMDDQRLTGELISRFMVKNYVPVGARAEYAAALVSEFSKCFGPTAEPLLININTGEEVKSNMEIKVLGPGCKNCKTVETAVLKVLADLGVQAEVKKIENMGEITAHGILMTPGLIINGQIKAAGKVPKEHEIKQWIEAVS